MQIKTIPPQPVLRQFLVVIGQRGQPRESFEVMAENAQRAGEQADDLALPGERVEVRAIKTLAPFRESDFEPICDEAVSPVPDVDAMRRVGAL